ncbi:hypothetical protein ACFFGV_05365 [Pontibacillus salicampi]|uniref:Uncharacterized protein n=1 Tax=Pontibacillus salicampi TaxID=1449801 RepID=A0ABV6LL35_9BACI
MNINSTILSGEFDETTEELTIERLKHVDTVSVWNRNQLQSVYDYLSSCASDKEQILTINDQILVRLTQQEIVQLVEEMEKLLRYKSKDDKE